MNLRKKMLPLEILFGCMRLAGIWKRKEGSNVLFYSKAVIQMVLCLYFNLGLIIHCVNLSRDERTSLAELVEAEFSAECIATLIYNIIGLLISKDTSMELFECLRDFKKFGEPTNLYQLNIKAEVVGLAMVLYSFVFPFIIQIIGSLSISECIQYNNDTGRDFVCGYAATVAFPYEINYTPVYELNLILLFMGLLLTCSCGILIACLSYAAMEFIILRLEHLREMLLTVSQLENTEERQRRIRICVRYHLHIINLVEKTNQCFTIVLTPIFFQYSVNIGLALFTFLLSYTVKSLLSATAFLVGLLIVSYSADRLVERSESIAMAAYNINWYKEGTSLQKDIILIMLRAQKPLAMKMGPFGCISLPTYAHVIGGAYSLIVMRFKLLADK